MHSRRTFIRSSFATLASVSFPTLLPRGKVMTVEGSIDSSLMGTTLIHEHILVDFIGADKTNPSRWERESVINKMLPYLQEVKQIGCQTLIDCTPNYLGRDVMLLKNISEKSGLTIITNTGYYGGSDNKFLPSHAFEESAEQLSRRWISECKRGIAGTDVKPGFIKISVNDGPLSPISVKLIQASAFTHLKTGLTIASHTGTAIPAFEQLDILEKAGVHPDAFIWVHAQNEKDWDQYIRAARVGCWVSLDGVMDNNIENYTAMLLLLKKEKCLHRVLISHDAGWYDPEKPDGEIRKYTAIFEKLIPALEANGFLKSDVKQLIVMNPEKAFTLKVRRW